MSSSSTPTSTPDNNNNNDNTKIVAERARKQYLVEQELAQFARLYYARASEEQICQSLKIHRATYYRYLKKISAQQQEILVEYYQDTLKAEIASFRNTLRIAEVHMRKILDDANVPPAEKVDAANLMCEIANANVTLFTQGPVQTLRAMPITLRKKVNDAAAPDDEEEEEDTKEDARTTEGTDTTQIDVV
jgi:AcrR family transcriptional regulator